MPLPEWAMLSDDEILAKTACEGVGPHHQLAVRLGVASLLYCHRLANDLGMSVNDLTPEHVVDAIVSHSFKQGQQ